MYLRNNLKPLACCLQCSSSLFKILHCILSLILQIIGNKHDKAAGKLKGFFIIHISYHYVISEIKSNWILFSFRSGFLLGLKSTWTVWQTSRYTINRAWNVYDTAADWRIIIQCLCHTTPDRLESPTGHCR